MAQARQRVKGFFAITPEQVDRCFLMAQEQVDYVINLYTLVFPDWEELVSMDGRPKVGEAAWLYICRKAMDFDLLHHSTMPGGMWLNNGFSASKSLPDWQVRPCPVTRRPHDGSGVVLFPGS